MTALEPGILVGTVRHRRFTPRRHTFTYPVFMAFLDIDRIPSLMRVSPFTSYNRWNWASFDERDHFGDPRRPLRERLHDEAVASGTTLPDGPIYLLTHLRYFGYGFNPVSFFYCHDANGSLRSVLAEVNNTFGETHNYWLGEPERRPGLGKAFRYETPKVFHVSPFNPLGQRYEWMLTPPGLHTLVHMNTIGEEGTVMDATLSLRRQPWRAGVIHRVLARFPFVTAKVIAAIHFEALRLSLKRVPFHPHPGTPPSLGTRRRFVPSTAASRDGRQGPPLDRMTPEGRRP